MGHPLPDSLIATLVDPESREPLRLAAPGELEALRGALAKGSARRQGGGSPPSDFEAAFLTPDGRRAYLVIDGIADFLVEDRIELDVPVTAA